MVFYLNNIIGVLSEPISIDIGFILGPLLFILYINDLPNIIDDSCKVVLYADDTALFYASNDPDHLQTVLNSQLCKVDEWLQKNKRTMNVKKTNLMLIGKRLTNFQNVQTFVNGEELCRVTNCKYLSIWIDKNLNWNVNTEKKCAIRSANELVSFED